MQDLLQRLIHTDKPVVLYGMGNGADKIMAVLQDRGISVSGVFAGDGFVRGHSFRGFEVMSYSQAKKLFPKMTVLVCFGSHRPEVINAVRQVASEQELYMPDVPVFGDGLFDMQFARDNRQRLEWVYDRLADEESKRCFENCVRYRISGDPEYLFECESGPEQAYGLLCPGDNEVYMDLGAYDGDTVREFLSHVSGYEKIYAVEPDVKNFKKLIKNTEGLPRLECINVGIHSKRDRLGFCTNAGRNSSVGDSGEMRDVDSVDDLLSGRRVSMIKMDVEGQEREAVEGARQSILNWKPKLTVACYHRTSDYFSLPEAVLGIRDDYRMYMRHHPCFPAWDTYFYFI